MVKAVSGWFHSILCNENRQCRHILSKQREPIKEDNKLTTDVPDILSLGAERDLKNCIEQF